MHTNTRMHIHTVVIVIADINVIHFPERFSHGECGFVAIVNVCERPVSERNCTMMTLMMVMMIQRTHTQVNDAHRGEVQHTHKHTDTNERKATGGNEAKPNTHSLNHTNKSDPVCPNYPLRIQLQTRTSTSSSFFEFSCAYEVSERNFSLRCASDISNFNLPPSQFLMTKKSQTSADCFRTSHARNCAYLTLALLVA